MTPEDNSDDPTLMPARPSPPGPSGPPDHTVDTATPHATGQGSGHAADTSTGSNVNALPPGTRLEEFELHSVLGEGGFGIVYVAWDHLLQRKVAVKEYMPSAMAGRSGQTQVQVLAERWRETFDKGLESFVNEARTLARFDHPALLKVFRFWRANGTAYMAMPLYDGVTWKERLRQMREAGQAASEAWLLSLLGPLTEALALIHADNTFHRDIAPDNVLLLAGSGQPVLLDFGAARSVIGGLTQDLTVILKPGYAPVEQYAEVPSMTQGAWTDVYALAASVHFALTGKVPPASVSRLITDAYIPLATRAPAGISPGFAAALDKALRVRPDERTPSMAAFRKDLGLPPTEQAAAPALAVAPPIGATARTPGNRRSALRLGAGAVGALALGGLGWWASQGRTGGATGAPSAAPAPTPSPAAAPVVTPSATGPFEVRTEFQRVITGQTPQFTVRAAPVKTPLRIGRDQLAFTVSSSRAGFVQVLTLGPDGTLWLLFPNAQASDNRIAAGQTLNLPQAQWALDVAEPAGTEQFLVIVSAQPRDYSELSQQREYIFLKLPTGAEGAAALARWTRSTPLLLGSLKSCPSADCEDYGAAAFSVEIVR
ncbi:MAG: serine/threonine-protein kinase [Rubrivivax sp.]|nr:serine/threonine-protein kinase [Rubrivivax sp.]